MVRAPQRSEIRRQWKIYGESNRQRFLQIFGDLRPSQIPAIYRQLLSRSQIARIIATGVKGTTGSRDVFPASHGVLARAGAGASAQRENTRIGQAAAVGRVRGRIGCGPGGGRAE